jgi:diguanylate cyclase (GGDEF)-like protein
MVQEMAHLARHDALTGLPNRSLLKERLTQAILLAGRNHSHLAVLFLDLDGFKRINDSLGHQLGDQLLQSVAARLVNSVRKSDTVSRQGGDEFVILLPEVPRAADADQGAARILADIRKVHSIADRSLSVTASIGISSYPDGGEDADTLIKNADTAMYHAKEQGRDTYRHFSPIMNRRHVERQSLEGQLQAAAEEGELRVHYQPKVNLRTGAITSAEALVRWQHPDRGLLLPGQFLGAAEDTGMIIPLGRWVLHETCRQTREWLDAGIPAVPVAVNVSSLEFHQGEQFLAGVEDALAHVGLTSEFLELELTETVLMRHADSAADTLGRLKGMGIRLAIDDFGTGYSSLSYLTRFRFDALKLDQSLVRDIAVSADNAIVVSSVISMARTLGHLVIAEGVETSDQLTFLQTHNCDEGQGYYFSRPVVAPQFAGLLETRPSSMVLR